MHGLCCSVFVSQEFGFDFDVEAYFFLRLSRWGVTATQSLWYPQYFSLRAVTTAHCTFLQGV